MPCRFLSLLSIGSMLILTSCGSGEIGGTLGMQDEETYAGASIDIEGAKKADNNIVVSGTVSESPAGDPVPEATVILRNIITRFQFQTQTDEDGLFSFAHVPPARFALIVRKLGYERHRKVLGELETGGELELNIELKPELSDPEYFVALPPAGSDSNPGTREKPWATLSHANSTLQPGDIVRLREGVYREQIRPSRSGTPGLPITYSSFGDEKVVITDVGIGINLDQRSEIVIDGIAVDGNPTAKNRGPVSTWLSMEGASHVVVRNSTFRYSSNSGVKMSGDCSFNALLNNTLSHTGNPTKSGGNLLVIGAGCRHNLLQGNRISHAGHYLAILFPGAKFNVIRDNEFLAQWHGGLDVRGESNLVDNNIMAYASKLSVDRATPPGMRVAGTANIFRRNEVYRNDFYAGLGSDKLDKKNNYKYINHDARIYSNVFYDSEGWWNWIYRTPNGVWGNVLKNNIAHATGNAPLISYAARNTTTTDRLLGSVYAGNTLVGNLISAKGIGDHDLDWFQENYPDHFQKNIDSDPMFVAPEADVPDFRLSPLSPSINKGVFLTRTLKSGSGTTLQVEDARYFSDGFGVVEGDLIQLEGEESTARVLGVNYKTHELSLDRPLTWTSKQGLSLPYRGSAPDCGKFEF